MMEGPGAVAIVRVAHVIAELDKLVGGLVSPGYTAGRRRPHHRAAAARERRQLPCTAHPQRQTDTLGGLAVAEGPRDSLLLLEDSSVLILATKRLITMPWSICVRLLCLRYRLPKFIRLKTKARKLGLGHAAFHQFVNVCSNMKCHSF